MEGEWSLYGVDGNYSYTQISNKHEHWLQIMSILSKSADKYIPIRERDGTTHCVYSFVALLLQDWHISKPKISGEPF